MADPILFSLFRLPLVIELVEDGTSFATNPALNDFLVLAGTIEEVLSLTPGIAKPLLDAMREKGIVPNLEVETLQFPVKVDILVG